MSKFLKSVIVLYLVLLLGNLILDIPRLASGYYSTSVDLNKVEETYQEARDIAAEKEIDFGDDINDPKYLVTFMRSYVGNAIWSKVKIGFSIRILIITLIFFSIINSYKNFKRAQPNQHNLLLFGLIAIIGFLFTLAMEQVTQITGMYYFSLTICTLLFLGFSNYLQNWNWGWIIIPLVATLFYLDLSPVNGNISNHYLFEFMIQARISTTLYYILGFVSWSIYFIAPIYFIRINWNKSLEMQ